MLAKAGENLPEGAQATFDRAAAAGLALELAALEPGEAPDWEGAERFLEALVLEEVEDDLLEQCGVEPDRDPRETWLEQVQQRPRSDLEHFCADTDAGHGWMCRLLDSSVLAAAGFARMRKAELLVSLGLSAEVSSRT